MSKGKAKTKAHIASVLAGLTDGSSVFLELTFTQKKDAADLGRELEHLAWIPTADGGAIKSSQITSLKSITWSEK